MLVYHFEGMPRNPWVVALKNVLTLGIYTKVWLYRVNREMDGREGFHIHLSWLAVMLWLPVVTPAIVKFQTAARLNQMVSDPVTIPLIRARWLGRISLVPVLGAGFYAYWVQSSLNKFWFWHRRKERYYLNRERIKQLAQEPETEENLKKRFALEQECRRIEKEMEEEIEAVRLKWGDEKFNERKRRADLRIKRGRLTRKEVAELRRRQNEERKAARARRRRERSLIARYKPRRADPEDDAAWEPYTPVPERSPEEIRAAAESEGREPTRKEVREIKRAEALVKAREKESERLTKRRAKLLARKRSKEARLEAQATKKEQKATKGAKKDKKGKKGKKSRKKDKKSTGVEEGEPGAEGPRPLRRRWLVLPPQRDPEVDGHWQPRTPEPEVDPDAVLDAAEAEGREPTKKELKQVKRAEALLEKREKESESLGAARQKAREKAAKQAESLEQKAAKKKREDAKKEREEEKAIRREEKERLKAEKAQGKGSPKKKGKKEKKPEGDIPKKRKVARKKGTKGKPPAKTDSQGDGALRVLKVRCPQCSTQVPVRKPDDRPARLKCPSCGLVGKV